MNRRSALRSVALGAATGLAGCFGVAHRRPPEEGEFTVRNEDDAPHEVEVTLSAGDRVALDATYDLDPDASGPTETVEPATYDVAATLDGGRTERFEWEVTTCRSLGHVQVGDDETLRFETSNC